MTTSSEELTEITGVVAALMDEYSTEADVRRLSEPGAGTDSKLWLQLAEAGIAGIIVDPQYGGVGLGPIELEAVAEPMGAALACTPLLSSAVLAAGLLQALDDESAKSRLLPGIASGETIATVALTGIGGTWDRDGIGVSVDDEGAVTGRAEYVTDGASADLLLVVARNAGRFGYYEVAPDAAGVTVRRQSSFDGTQRLASIDFAAAPATRIGTDETWQPAQRALDLGVVALAGDQVGGARAIFERTIDYAKTRIQFGRTIGSFQAIKHMAADLYLELESAVSAARHAARCLAANEPGTAEAIALAGFTCAEAYRLIAADAIFMHGGIGFTWEYPAHLYLRRARADERLLGSPRQFRERYLTELGG